MVETKPNLTYAERFASIKIRRPDYDRAVQISKEIAAPGRLTFLEFFGVMLRVLESLPEKKRRDLLREYTAKTAA